MHYAVHPAIGSHDLKHWQTFPILNLFEAKNNLKTSQCAITKRTSV